MNIAGNVRVYRRKPFAVEAIQWTGKNTAKVEDFLGKTKTVVDNADGTYILVKNPFNVQKLYKGDYVVREVDGNCYVVSKVMFEVLYDYGEGAILR